MRTYLSARWLDALASGASVAGVAPECASARRLLWEGATLDLAGTQLDAGMLVVAGAVEQWRPVRAVENYAQALERIDWRLRLREVSAVIGHSSAVLDHELSLLATALHEARQLLHTVRDHPPMST